jgi:proline dehydrogenase
MSLARRLLLAGSESVWLRERATKYRFVRRSVSTFMPGEQASDALDAAARLAREDGVGSIFTRLGENVTTDGEADAVRDHYLDVLDRIAATRADGQISIKLTQLGLDLDRGRTLDRVLALVRRADAVSNFVWIDMESTKYVDVTLDIFRAVRGVSTRAGVCLQAYLYRTAADLEALFPLAPAIRLVKGAYREPPNLAFPRKADVDENYYKLATMMLGDPCIDGGARLGIGTHDDRLIARLRHVITGRSISPAAYEVEMLYGIRRGLQKQLASEKVPLRVLVAYGEYWFPWYMRRLAERPANVWFVAKNLLKG